MIKLNKKVRLTLLPLAVLVLFSIQGCEDVIEVDIPENETKLIVDALIRVDENEDVLPIEIIVKETSSFFNDVTTASIESAIIFYGTPNPDAPEILEGGGVSNLAESEPGSGIWVPDPTFDSDQRIRVSSISEGDVFQLTIRYNDETYFASTTYVKSTPIDSIVQGDATLFAGNETEVIISFTDVDNRDDFYVLDLDFNEFLVTEDELYQGQTFTFSYFYDEDLEFDTDATINISLLGADEAFYNYMNQLIVQSGGDQGPFATPAATVRGNVFNITGIDNEDVFDNTERTDNFALGYFAVVETYTDSIVIEQNED